MTGIKRLQPRYASEFAKYASPDNIAAHLQARRADLRNLEGHIAWLEQLAKARAAQIASGTWPGDAA